MEFYLHIEHSHTSHFELDALLTYEDKWSQKIIDLSRKKESLLSRLLLDKLCKKHGFGSIQACGFQKTTIGKPFFLNKPDIYFSITHCDGYVWVAVSNSPIGIDFEKINKEAKNDLEVAFTQADWEIVSNDLYKSFQYFSLKEAYSKMIGTGFTTDPSMITLSFLQENSFHTPLKSLNDTYILTLTAQLFDPNEYLKSTNNYLFLIDMSIS